MMSVQKPFERQKQFKNKGDKDTEVSCFTIFL